MSFYSETSSKLSLFDSILDWLEVIILSIFAVLLIFSYLMRIFVVDGPSMISTLYDQDKLLVTNVLYSPKQGDVVVIYSKALKKDIVKRIIAVEGQTVTINYDNDEVKVDGRTVKEDYTHEFMYDTGLFDMNYFVEQSGEYVYHVPQDSVFVMGDNRNQSTDSRAIGFIKNEDILGKVFFRISSTSGNTGFMAKEVFN